jgi:osmotically inducible lipoprotein OsmB
MIVTTPAHLHVEMFGGPVGRQDSGRRNIHRRNTMNSKHRLVVSGIAVAIVLSLGACAGMSERDEATVVGAGVGGVAGAVLTGGSPAGTVGGAVVGGVIGNQIKK